MIWAVSLARFKSDEYTAEIAISFESLSATFRKAGYLARIAQKLS